MRRYKHTAVDDPSKNALEESLPTLLVGVGASAGGLDAFKKLLEVLPVDSGMAFLLVQHLDPTHESLLAELLAPKTTMLVTNAKQGAVVVPNTVYIIRPHTALAVNGGRIELTVPKVRRGVRLTVDHLFQSLARECGPRAVAVVLTGAGSDGSAGIREIKAEGGLTIAQRPESGQQSGMPRSAIETGLVDLVLDIEDMPAALKRFAAMPVQTRLVERSPKVPPSHAAEVGPVVEDEQLVDLGALLNTHQDFDLSVYKTATVRRRVTRRMMLGGIGSMGEYLAHLRETPLEQAALINDLLINVTEFFRDLEAFATLREKVLQPLVERAEPGTDLRVWVPGCATGEEAYSIGMECLDAIDASGKALGLQIFATDVDHEALSIARAGMYPSSIEERVSARRLAEYFNPAGDRGYRVRAHLRGTVSFAAHDLTKDPPFSKMDLVSCRNLLIYFTRKTQERVLHMLHFALGEEGSLLLGGSETLGKQQDQFSVISKSHRIFRRQEGRSSTGYPGAFFRGLQESSASRQSRRGQSAQRTDAVSRAVLTAVAPPTVVVGADGAVIYAHGELGPFLRIPEGDSPRFDLSSVLRPELGTRTRGVLHKCRASGAMAEATSAQTDAGFRVVITARPAVGLDRDTVVISFEQIYDDVDEAARPTSGSEPLIEQLEGELAATREDLQSTVEELETSNEELRSSHEEATSVNEELQSANEELEASSEELRSLNEEITTVNHQLRDKIQQLEQTHDDLANLFSSTKIATVFLDDRSCIKKFTPAAAELLHMDHGDVGRHIDAIGRDLLGDGLQDAATRVLQHLRPESREIQAHGRWVTRRVLPYLTDSRRIEGVVVTFIDVTELKVATERLVAREKQQRVIARAGLQALTQTDIDVFLRLVVRDIQQTLQTDFCKILELQPGGERLRLRAGIGWRKGLVGTSYIDTGPDSQAGYTLQSSSAVIVEDLAGERRFSGPELLTEHEVVSGISCVIGEGETRYGVLGAHTREPRAFDLEDTDFLQAMAAIADSAIARHQTRLAVALELSVAQALAEHSSREEVIQGVMACIAAELGVAIVEIWKPEESPDGLLERRHLHIVPDMSEKRVRGAFVDRTFRPGEGLVGHTFTSREAMWATELGSSPWFVRREAADSLGINSGVTLPIIAGRRVLGVVVAFSQGRIYAGPTLLRRLESVGRALGDRLVGLEHERRAQRMAAITESAQDAVYVFDNDDVITDWLAGAARMYGYEATEIVGRSVDTLIPADQQVAQRQQRQRVRGGELLEPVETARLDKHGSRHDVSVRASPVRSLRGELVAVSAAERDIGLQKEVERRLTAADQQKDQFLAMLGHELRNPLAAIRGAAELLSTAEISDPAVEKTQRVIERQSRHMAKLLDGLLDVSRVAQGKIVLEREVVDFTAICRDVMHAARERLEVGSLTIELREAERPLLVDADPVRLIQIVDNLVSNSVKYTSEGGRIELTLATVDRCAELTVTDDGIGIDADLLPHVFEMFRQSDQTLDRTQGGLGLGLSLVRSLVELHGGSVSVHSDGVGKGATFRLRLPLALTSEAPAETTTRGEPQSLDLLLIEDNEDAAQMLTLLLQSVGHRVRWAGDGSEGIRLATEAVPDAILCDVGLPGGLSGFDVARELRANPLGQSVPLVAISGYGRLEDKARAQEAGFNVHLTKPVSLETLQQVLATVARSSSARP